MPTLVIQMGHCYRRRGATGTTGEQAYATRVADACKRLLHGRGGWSVRPILADEDADRYGDAEAFAAIHCDGSKSKTARGASVGYRTPEGQRFGAAFKRAYQRRGWSGFRPDNYTDAMRGYYGVRTAVAEGVRRAVIIECGFLTNEDDRERLTAEGGPERVARAIGDALGIPHTPKPAPVTPAPVIEEDEDMAKTMYVKTKSRPHIYAVTRDSGGLAVEHIGPGEWAVVVAHGGTCEVISDDRMAELLKEGGAA